MSYGCLKNKYLKMKTIFITLSSPLEFRNLFAFPGCVFDELKKAAVANPMLRIVALANQKDFEKYGTVLSGSWNDRVVLEGVTINYNRSHAQRLFLFFSSYLLYTKTTEILATMGMRPGEPPAGGKRWLNPIKRILAATLGRFRFVRETVVHAFYFLVYRDRPFQELFQRYRPDAVLISSVYNRFDRRVSPEAWLRKIPIVGLSAGWDHLDKYYLPFQATRFLAASEQMKRAAVAFQGYPAERVSIVGYPQYDFLVDPHFVRPRTDILAHMGCPPNARYLMYVSGSAYCPDEPDVIQEILSWIARGDFGENVYLVIRPYLGSRGRDKAFDVAKFNRFKEHPKVFFYDQKLPGYLDELTLFVNIMRHAHAIIAVYSTALLESAILDRPIVAPPFDGHTVRPLYRSIRRFRDFVHFQDVIRFGGMREAFSFPELKKILADYLADPSRDAAARAKMAAELCYRLDGKASKRVAEAVLSLV